MTLPPTDDLLEGSDVARVLGLSYSGVHALITRGDLKPWAKTVRGVRLFLREDVEALRVRREK